MLKTTRSHKEYWESRNIDWEQAYSSTQNHPHRQLILNKLKELRFGSLLEVGCASGPNLIRIQKEFPKVRLGGIDVNKDAISEARRVLAKNAVFDVSSIDKMFFNDKSVDVVLSDMALIYFGPLKIRKAIEEIKRVARSYVLFCEFHSKNPLKRAQLRLSSGYNAYNYEKLLRKHGFYDIELEKVSEKDWPGGNPQKDFCYIITARI